MLQKEARQVRGMVSVQVILQVSCAYRFGEAIGWCYLPTIEAQIIRLMCDVILHHKRGREQHGYCCVEVHGWCR